MSLNVVSSFNGVTDPDAGAYIAAVEAADGNQLLEFAVGKAINDFVVGCKADGIWDAIKASCILAGARTLSGALVPLKGAAPTNFNFVAGDYNRKTGLVGDGSTKYLNSNRNNNADPQDSQHLAVHVSASATSSALTYPSYIGSGSSFSGSSQIGRLNNNGNLYTRSRSAVAGTTVASTTGFIAINRANSTGYSVRASAVNTAVTATSQTPRNVSVWLYRDADSPSDSYSNARLAFYSIGESLDLARLDSRVTALLNAFGAAIP